MSLKVTGKVSEILELKSGTSAAGNDWQKLTFVVDVVNGDYTDQIPFSIMKQETIDKFTQYVKVGDIVDVSFNLKGREYNGNWYLDASAWKVWKDNPNAAPVAPAEAFEPADSLNEDFDDDLPF